MTKRVVECDICGEPLAAANDEELLSQLQSHIEREHPDSDVDRERARRMVAQEAYDAGDS